MNTSAIKKALNPLAFDGHSLTADELDYACYYGIYAEALHAEASHQLGYIDCSGYRIACHVYSQPNPKGTFFLLHGYYDHVGLCKHVIEFLLKRGYNILAYDLPGHGLSSGTPASIPDFSIYRDILNTLLTASKEHLPKPWHAFGQSTGCAIITELLLSFSENNQPPPFSQVVLSAPLVRPYLWKWGRLQLYASRWFIKKIPRKFTDNCRDKTFLAFAQQDPLAPRVLPVEWVSAMDRWVSRVEKSRHTIPVTPLIIQGTDDKTVDAKHNIPVLNRLYKKTDVLFLDGARHHLPNEIEPTRHTYMQWLSTFF